MEDYSLNLKKTEENAPLENFRKGIPTKFLRVLGVLFIILASAIYLFQGIEDINPYQRHWIFLGITALFGGLTWLLGGVLKEMKGARTFISLAVATIPVLFTQLGAMLHGLLVDEKPEMAAILDFSSNDGGLFALVAVLTSAVSIPLILFGYRILARNQRKPLTLLLLLGNALLLIPFRGLVPVGLTLTAALAVILSYTVKKFQRDPSVRNFEGTIALINLFVPVAIIAIRTASLYAQGDVFTGLLCILVGASAVVLPIYRKTGAATAVQVLGIFSVGTGWIVALGGFGIGMEALQYYFLVIPAGILAYTLSFTLEKSAAVDFRRLAVVVLAAALAYGQLQFNGAFSILGSVLGGIAFIAAAARLKEKTAIFTGIAAVTFGVIGMLIHVLTALSETTWLVLMFGGILIIIGGSLTELFNRRWKGYAVHFKEELSGWN